MAPFLDERGRRLFTASEARAAGRGGVTAVATATGVARSTIGRGLAELRGGRDDLGSRIRRPGGGRRPALETQPGLLEALGELVQSAIRGDPEAALLWVSKSQRQPAISVDTKKKELVGDFKNGGRELRPKGQPEAVRVHDFALPELGKVAPYGVYDIAANAGWVNLGIDHDTAAFAVESIRRWWRDLGRPR